jgi:hypothetical protein
MENGKCVARGIPFFAVIMVAKLNFFMNATISC